MKKFFSSHWERILYGVFFSGVLLVNYQSTTTGWPNDALMLGLLMFGVIFILAIIGRLLKVIVSKKPQAMRYWVYLVYNALTITYLALLYDSRMTSLRNAPIIFSLLLLSIVGFSIARASIWLYKRHQAKKVETEHD